MNDIAFSNLLTVSVLCVTAAVMSLLIFIYYRFIPRDNEKKEANISGEIPIGNTQWIGKKEVRREYFSAITYKERHFAAIAYGLGRGSNGTQASIIAVSILKSNFYRKIEKNQSMKEYVHTSVQKIHKNLSDALWDNGQKAAFAVAIVDKGIISYAGMGHCYLLIYRKKELLSVLGTTEGDHGLHIGEKRLQKGDRILVMGQGAYKGLSEMEIAEEMEALNSPQETCDNLLAKIRRKQFKYQENVTLIILENLL